MQTVKLFLILTLAVLLYSSCRKNEDAIFDGIYCPGNCYILTGKLVDSAANTGIAKGEIKIYFNDNTGTFSSKTIFLGPAVTDANGNYSFKFDASRFTNVNGYFYVNAYSGNMFGGDQTYPNRVATFFLDTSLYNQPIIQNFAMFRQATIKVRVIASTVTNFQYLTVDYNYGKTGQGIIFNGNRQIDTTITWRTAGDLRTFVEATAVGNGVNIKKRDTVIVPTNASRQIEIRL